MPLHPRLTACLLVVSVGVSGLRDKLPLTTTVCKTFPGLSKVQLELCHKYPNSDSVATCFRVSGLRDELPLTTTVCKTFPGLSKVQLELCHKYPNSDSVATCFRVSGLRDELPLTTTVCKTFPGLSKVQLELCHKYPNSDSVATCFRVSGLRDELPLTATVCKTFPGLSKVQLELCHKYPNSDSVATCFRVSGLRDELPLTATVCKTFPGLTKAQLELCHKYPDVTAAAFHGLQMAVEECQYQFRWHRWNCSSLNTKNRNPHSSVILQKGANGYRESAFSYAISAAGVAHSVARACGQGSLLACGCEPKAFSRTRGSPSNRWKWGGCSHNLEFGIKFSTMFLDLRERGVDIQSRINLHNNEAGRLAVASKMQTRCKCHGMSGSCELKTCWKAAPDFRMVGGLLKDRFRTAVMVDQSNMGNGSPLLIHRRRRIRYKKRKRQKKRRRDLSSELLYYEKSPNFCDPDPSQGVEGTFGRRCNRTSRGVDGCASLCCGRGYNVIKQRRTDRCHCRFHWCCYVECQNCTVEEWITACK